MTGPERGRRRRAWAAAAVTAGLIAAGLGLGTGTAAAFGSRTYSYECGTSRGATLHVTIYDDRPGHYEAVPDGEGSSRKEGDITPNAPHDIPLPGGSGIVEVNILGSAPGYYDESNGVGCESGA